MSEAVSAPFVDLVRDLLALATIRGDQVFVVGGIVRDLLLAGTGTPAEIRDLEVAPTGVDRADHGPAGRFHGLRSGGSRPFHSDGGQTAIDEHGAAGDEARLRREQERDRRGDLGGIGRARNG